MHASRPPRHAKWWQRKKPADGRLGGHRARPKRCGFAKILACPAQQYETARLTSPKRAAQE
jgi:hypothetical protein